MNRAFLFPGQGSQVIGMGKDFYDNFTVAKETFQIVDEVLKQNLSKLIFTGNLEELTLTQNTQPALMVVSMAIFNTLKEQTEKDISDLCSYAAGHSLGEYSALCAASSISLADTARLLHIRGTSMQSACKAGQGSMAAIIGMKITEIEKVLKNTLVGMSGVCQIANDNIDGQTVISGDSEIVDLVVAVIKDSNYKAVKLNVSAPFHCALMKPAEFSMQLALAEISIKKPLVPVITNISAQLTTDSDVIKQNLIQQVCGRVRWRETMDLLKKLSVTEIVEIGAGKVLSNMTRKANYPFSTMNISNINEFDDFARTI